MILMSRKKDIPDRKTLIINQNAFFYELDWKKYSAQVYTKLTYRCPEGYRMRCKSVFRFTTFTKGKIVNFCFPYFHERWPKICKKLWGIEWAYLEDAMTTHNGDTTKKVNQMECRQTYESPCMYKLDHDWHVPPQIIIHCSGNVYRTKWLAQMWNTWVGKEH